MPSAQCLVPKALWPKARRPRAYEERGTEGQHDRRPFALWTAGSSYPTPSAHSLCTTRLRQWCHAHAEEGLLASESPGQHVALTPKFDQQLLANFCLGCWPPGNGSKTGDRPAGAGSAERGPAAELKMRRGWRLEGPQTWSEGCVLPVLADLPRLWRMDLRSQTLCHSVSRVLTHSLRASWVASIHTGAVLATQLQPTASSSVHLGTFKYAYTPPRGPSIHLGRH